MRIEEQADTVTFTCESPNQEKVSNFKIKLTELAQVVSCLSSQFGLYHNLFDLIKLLG